MNLKDEHRILAISILGVLALWTADAAVDAFFFARGAFFNLLFDQSPHELYFRSFMAFGFLTFGMYLARHRSKQRVIEERYRNLVELSTDIIYISDRDGNQVFMNDAAFRTLERAPDEVIGRPWTELIHPDDRMRSIEKRRELATLNSDVFDFENRYVTKSGKVITVLHNVRVLRDAKGAFAGTQGIARDITKRKQAEEDLQLAHARAEDEKARSESIISAIGDGISIQDTRFRVTYQNQAHKTISGADKAGHYCYEAYARSSEICPGCPVAESFKDGKVHTLEKTVVGNNGVRTLEIKASPLMDSTGRIIAGIETVRDITERRKTQEKVKLFSEAIEEAMDGILIVDLEGRIVYSNKAIMEIYGYSPAELAGRHVNELNADREFAYRVIIPRVRRTGRWSGEMPAVHKDGRMFTVWLSASVVRDEQGKPIAVIGIIRDITDRKQAESILKRHHEQLMKLVEVRTRELTQANENLRREIADRERMEEEILKAQKLESLSILAGGIAHDFNNLLASIMGNISLAMLDLDPVKSTFHQLEAAERASLRAQDLTRQLLTFSKSGAPVTRTTEISELVTEAAGFALRGSRVRHDFFFPDDLWLADVDEGQISQVIHNLVINADHAMPAGGTITIRCENSTVKEPTALPLRPGDYVKVSVQDLGVGIAKEHLPKIFDPYFTTKQKGSGLGLATAYSIIKKHGGHIAVRSELGAGTTFSIYLPASHAPKIAKKTGETRVLSGSGKILLMDDEEDVRKTTGDVLARLGYSVEFADDGLSAVELYLKAMRSGDPFHAVIMDLTVPGGMGGKEALTELLAFDPEVRAIVSSGYSNDPIMADYRKYGFKGVVAKPYRIRDLGETLHVVLTGNGG